ncbi:MAG: STAS domain-containing protein [Aestuariivita sp.]|nr:STAS domain-containing protein [Aestuariivita sp.]
MKLKVSKHNDVTISEVAGRIDGTTARDFEEQVTATIQEKGGPLVCDLAGVTYISSAGLRSILVVAKRLAKEGNFFTVCGHTGTVAEVFRISGFEKIIPMHKTRDEALAAAEA